MKTPLFGALTCAFFVFSTMSIFAQGSLTPPSPPAATMKSLDQIEARTPISSTPFSISSAGSYYLTKNLAVTSGDAITITANNVTVDLNGFAITSTEASPAGAAVLISGTRTNIHVSNGNISGNVAYNAGTYSGTGFAYGIYCSGVPKNIRVSRVGVSGCLVHGIYLSVGSSSVVEFCTVQVIGSQGIVADSVTNSTADFCGSYAIFGTTVANCYAEGALNGTGIRAFVVQNSWGLSYGTGYGITAVSTAIGCYAKSLNGTALIAGDLAVNCFGESYSGSGFGVSANVVSNCSGYASGAGHGIRFFAIGSMCTGYSDNLGEAHVLGNGAAGPLNLP
jgi:hypothetical protein